MMTALRLPSVLLLADAAQALPELRRQCLALPQGQTWVLDGSLLREFDSAALSVLMELARLAVDSGATLRFEALPEPLHDLARVYGVEEVLVG